MHDLNWYTYMRTSVHQLAVWVTLLNVPGENEKKRGRVMISLVACYVTCPEYASQREPAFDVAVPEGLILGSGGCAVLVVFMLLPLPDRHRPLPCSPLPLLPLLRPCPPSLIGSRRALGFATFQHPMLASNYDI